MNTAGLAVKESIKAAKAQKLAEKGKVRSDSVADSDSDSAQQKPRAKRNHGRKK